MKDLPHNHVGILIYGYVLTSSERQPGFEGKIPGNVFTRVTKSPQGHVHQRKFLEMESIIYLKKKKFLAKMTICVHLLLSKFFE